MYLNYINNFRGVAILYIVIGHCISAFEWDTDAYLYKILTIVFTNGTVLFVFIAGYLFQHLSKRYSFKSYIYKKVLYVGFPYIICSMPAIIYFTAFAQRSNIPDAFYEHPVFIQVILFYIKGNHLAPYWFIPMIFLFYLASPALIYFDRKKSFYYFLPVFIFMSLLVPRSESPFHDFFHFFSVYSFGMFCSREKQLINRWITMNSIMLINSVIIVLLIHIQCCYIYDPALNYIQKMFLCLLLLSILYRYDNLWGKRLTTLASTSFGIYFIHSYLISGIKVITIDRIGQYFSGDLIAFFVFSTLIAIISMLVILLIQKIAGHKSRYLIGS